MKKTKATIILALIFILQLAVPLSVMGMREIAENSGLQGKIKVETAWYYEEKELLDLALDDALWRNVYANSYTPIYLDENGYFASTEKTKIKPSGPYLSREKIESRYSEFEKEKLNLLVTEKELHDILFRVICDSPYREIEMYVTASNFDGELFFKEFWVDGTKLLEFLY